MSGIIAVAAAALLAAVCGALLKKSNHEMALVLSLAAAVAVVLFAVLQAGEISALFETFTEIEPYETVLSVMLKALGIVLVGRIAVGVCKDAGENALAVGVEFSMQAALLLTALPLIRTLLEAIREMLKL